MQTKEQKIGVVLIGHGAPATDCPPRLVGELMGLEWQGNSRSAQVEERIAQLDAQIRNWPRHPGNDPYKAGLEKLARDLRPLLADTLFAIGYNEFCCPSIPQAIAEVIQQGAKNVWVIPSMLTPGGLHSEIDIPRALEAARKKHPEVSIEYVWPFDLKEVAQLLALHVKRALKDAPVQSHGR